MLTDSGFNYLRFAVFEIVSNQAYPEKRGNFVIGVPENTAPELLENHRHEEWTEILHQLLRPDEKLHLQRQLDLALGFNAQFVLWMILDYREIVKTEPMWKSPGGKKFGFTPSVRKNKKFSLPCFPGRKSVPKGLQDSARGFNPGYG